MRCRAGAGHYALVASLAIRTVDAGDYQMARRLVATAFVGEPFVSDYAAWPSAPNPVLIGAETAGHLVGVALATLPGECALCDGFDQSKTTVDTEAERIEHEFQLACRHSHLTNKLPPHAHIGPVATDPTLHGTGVGRLLMSALADRLRAKEVECVVLECSTSRAAFYEHCGFKRVHEFDDPGGPGLRAVLMRAGLRNSE